MRGGLGRTILTAFLLLSIVPLGLISFGAAAQAKRISQAKLKESLTTIAILTESRIQSWVAGHRSILEFVSNSLAPEPGDANATLLCFDNWSSALNPNCAQQVGMDREGAVQSLLRARFLDATAEFQSDDSAYVGWLLVDAEGQTLAAHPPSLGMLGTADLLANQQGLLEADGPHVQALEAAGLTMPMTLKVIMPIYEGGPSVIALLDLAGLVQPTDIDSSTSRIGNRYLLSPEGATLQLNLVDADAHARTGENPEDQTPAGRNPASDAALAGQSGVISYKDHQGKQVTSAYRWLPALNLALLVDQTQDTALSANEDLTVVLLGAALAMSLLTTLIAAAVTRRITRPIVQLTATAVQIAAGDLDQKVIADRRDEIGILARAFNVMTTKLRVFYEDLEHQVRERTQQLRDANEEIRYRATLLAISAEVGRIVTSILDRDILLSKVVELIRDCFQAHFVAIYILDENARCAVFEGGTGGLGAQLQTNGHRVQLDGDDLVCQAVNSRETRSRSGPCPETDSEKSLYPSTLSELAVPIKIGDRIIGVLDIHSAHRDAFHGDEIMVLETLAGQVGVAIENARAYDMEREAATRLRELERLRRRFLSNMSRELRLPLNNIIGFSRVILKGIDGPITDLQREDLTAIHESGQQLLVLINDILDIAHIESGSMEMALRPLDFGEIARSVIPTTNALLAGRPIQLNWRINPDLPPVLADAHRLRQVLLKLLANAVRFTQEGEITLCVWRDTDQIMATVADAGIKIPHDDREEVFEMLHQGPLLVEASSTATGLGLTFSKEIVELHGGRIAFENDDGNGMAFTIALPVAEWSGAVNNRHAET